MWKRGVNIYSLIGSKSHRLEAFTRKNYIEGSFGADILKLKVGIFVLLALKAN